MKGRYEILLEKFMKTSLRQSTTKVKSMNGKVYKAKPKNKVVLNPEDKSYGSLYISG